MDASATHLPKDPVMRAVGILLATLATAATAKEIPATGRHSLSGTSDVPPRGASPLAGSCDVDAALLFGVEEQNVDRPLLPSRHSAGDSRDDGTIWVYRYRRAGRS